MRNVVKTLLIALTIIISVAACDKVAQQGAVPKEPKNDPPAKARDLSGLKPCEVVPGEKVAAITGGKLLTKPAVSSSSCMYVVETSSGTENYNIFFGAPGIYETMLDAMSPDEKGEKVPDLWDIAYLGKGSLTQGFNLIVIKKEDMAIEVRGERKDVLIDIAKEAMLELK